MSSTPSISQPATAPEPANAHALVFDPDASFITLCNLRDPAQFKHVSIHDFPAKKSPEEMDAIVDTLADGLQRQCGIPLERIGRVRHYFQPPKLDDKVLVDIRHVSNPEVERTFVLDERKAVADIVREDYA
ncbi:hypothetical protein [Bordetella sp. LUAb4]|uniref:hypothetical protein n=1 Tax=Bordetella sp. LUAb4 TaxID=2843195 RepID=UPI001E28D8AB|nr:hypothetical protein [Bordetella sp. LUAb4]